MRKRHPSLMRTRFLKGVTPKGASSPDITWHGVRLHEPPWEDPESQFLAFTLGAVETNEEDLHIILNMSGEEFDVSLPDPMGKVWYGAVDTAKPSPEEVIAVKRQQSITEGQYHLLARSVAVFERR